MANTPIVHPVYVAINRPLTIGGAERRLFFLALVMGAATFTFFGRLLAGILMGMALYGAARWMTQTDPQWLRIILRSASARVRYDAGTLECLPVRRGDGR
jgi:type IV secretory pathway TrbD component